jgi:hypothetical protein
LLLLGVEDGFDQVKAVDANLYTNTDGADSLCVDWTRQQLVISSDLPRKRFDGWCLSSIWMRSAGQQTTI